MRYKMMRRKMTKLYEIFEARCQAEDRFPVRLRLGYAALGWEWVGDDIGGKDLNIR